MSDLKNKYKIIADSACDASEEIKAELGLSLVPLTLDLDGEIFVDDENLDLADYVNKYEACKTLPKTSCPTPAAFLKNYEEAEGDIYVITISANLSGTYNSALLAKSMYHEAHGERNIHVFNSCSAAPGQLSVAYEIKKQCDLGKSFEEVVKAVEEHISKMKTIFVLDKIDQLRKSGRMSLVTATFANVLNIKLILGATPEGQIKLFDKARGFRKAIDKMIDLLGEVEIDFHDRVLYVSHCFNLETAQYIADKVKQLYGVKKVVINQMQGLATTYAGRSGIILGI